MKIQNSNRAILILESPWELDVGDSNRSSVIPFVEGIAKFAGDTEVYHANFYDKNSFIKALYCLCKTSFQNTIVYIAAHGYKQKIGGVTIQELMSEVGEKSKKHNITGLMLGSCFVGGNLPTMEVYIQNTNLKWCAGYATSSAWLEGTFIDCAIMSGMSNLEHDDYNNEDEMIRSLGRSISSFSDKFSIGEDYHNKPVKLRNSLQFVIQPSGKGKRAKTVTDNVFYEYDRFQNI
ncbi:MAG: hypothetical protein CTY19_05760 [Methylomonas sp.]|nr:MAG: hypothetical protein CTY19_05760 [Methylomonas sp.]